MKNFYLVIILVLIIVSCTDKKEPEMIKLEQFSSKNYEKRDQNHPDAKVINQLKIAGSNLSKPHVPDFKFEFKDKEGAVFITQFLEAKGFQVQYFPPTEEYPTHGIKAEKEMLIELNTIADQNDEFRKISTENRGKFLGWGSTVVK